MSPNQPVRKVSNDVRIADSLTALIGMILEMPRRSANIVRTSAASTDTNGTRRIWANLIMPPVTGPPGSGLPRTPATIRPEAPCGPSHVVIVPRLGGATDDPHHASVRTQWRCSVLPAAGGIRSSIADSPSPKFTSARATGSIGASVAPVLTRQAVRDWMIGADH